jgi:hypothetical protein
MPVTLGVSGANVVFGTLIVDFQIVGDGFAVRPMTED